VEEDKIIELVEASCNPDKEEGEWISKFDIVKKGDSLQLSEKEVFGRCKQECRTIAKACEETISEVDTDLAEMIWQNKLSLSKLTNKICHSMSKACTKKAQNLKIDKRFDEEFEAMSEDERNADKIMKQMSYGPEKLIVLSAQQSPSQLSLVDLMMGAGASHMGHQRGINDLKTTECLNSLRCYNMETLEQLAEQRPLATPLVTVSNHHSCLDDPMLWVDDIRVDDILPFFVGMMKMRILLDNRKIRWTLGAKELLFSKPFHSFFFSRGKIIPIMRGMMKMRILLDNRKIRWTLGAKELLFSKPFHSFFFSRGKIIPIMRGMDDILPNKTPYIPTIMKRVTVLIGEPMYFDDILKDFKRRRLNAVSGCIQAEYYFSV
ncbi:predicted protein, partial [Nematostella vectensis]